MLFICCCCRYCCACVRSKIDVLKKFTSFIHLVRTNGNIISVSWLVGRSFVCHPFFFSSSFAAFVVVPLHCCCVWLALACVCVCVWVISLGFSCVVKRLVEIQFIIISSIDSEVEIIQMYHFVEANRKLAKRKKPFNLCVNCFMNRSRFECSNEDEEWKNHANIPKKIKKILQ